MPKRPEDLALAVREFHRLRAQVERAEALAKLHRITNPRDDNKTCYRSADEDLGKIRTLNENRSRR
jgi:hypothetical protein